MSSSNPFDFSDPAPEPAPRTQRPRRSDERRPTRDEDDAQPRRRAGRKPNTVLIVLGVVGGAAVLGLVSCCVLVGLVSKSGSSNGGGSDSGSVIELTGKKTSDLFDHPDQFRGKTIKVRALYAGGGRERGDGRPVSLPMIVFLSPTGEFEVQMEFPPDIELPNIQMNQTFYVTFVCEKGKLKEGNRVVKVQRA